MAAAIVVSDLVVEYPGLRALDGVGFEVPEGAITALVGPNGAGKTTLMRCMVALDRPFAGSVVVDRVDALKEPREVHRRVGYLSDNFGLYDDLPVARCLTYAAAVHGLRGDAVKARVAELTELVGIEALLERRAGTLSRGERQRVGLAQALAHRPKVLVLDEPASGLDPGARHELARLLKRLRAGGTTIVVSSHILAELEGYSNWMLTLDRGRIRGMVPVDRPATADARWLRLEVAGDPAAAAAVVAAVEGVAETAVEPGAVVLAWRRDVPAQAELIAHLVGQGVRITGLAPQAARMQDVYLAQLAPESGDRHEP